MKRLMLLMAALVLAGGLLQDVSRSHGGSYRGPGSSAPPAADSAGGSGGGSGPSSPGSPSGSGSSPSSGGTRSAGSSTGGRSPQPGAPSGGQADVTTWELWWGFNKEPYLNLKAAVHASPIVEGSDEHFLGHGAPGMARDMLRPTEPVIYTKLVPALLQALETESHNEIVTGALIALAKIGEPELPQAGAAAEADFELPSFAGVLQGFLSDPNQEISETAAVALGILADPSSVRPLIDLLGNSERGRELCARGHEVPWRTRAFAAYGLGLVGHASSEPELRAQIVRELAEASQQAAEMATPDVEIACLTAIGLVPLAFEDPLAPRAAGLRAPAAAKLAPYRGRRAQVRWMMERLADDAEHHILRAQGPTALARLTTGAADRDAGLTGEVARFLIELVNDERIEREVRQSAVLSLGAIADADRDATDVQVRAALVRIADRAPDRLTRNFALMALARAAARPGEGPGPLEGTQEVRVRLLAELESGNVAVRPWAALALGVLGRDLVESGSATSPEVDARLRAALSKARTPDEVGALAIALGLRGDIEARSLLREKLRTTQDDSARGYIAVGLGLSGATDEIDEIESVVRTAKYRPELLRQAAISLGLLGDKRIVGALIEMLEQAGSLSARAALASALGFIGDARSVEPLIEMLGDQEITGGARGFAAVALGIVGDKEPLPWNAKLSVDVNYRANVETLTNGAGTGILDIL